MTVLAAVQGDITTQDVDAVVNAANSSLLGGGGVDGAIHAAAGPALLQECRAIAARTGGCEPGRSVITGAGDLRAEWVIHTVGPVWTGEHPDEHDDLLTSCYRTALDAAVTVGARSVAFPNVSTGLYGFPKRRAAVVALGAVQLWLEASPTALDEVRFVCFDQENYELYHSRID